MSKERSTVEYLSNIQHIDTSKGRDSNFLSFIHDPFSLEIMNQSNYPLTDLQKREIKAASMHCAYAFKDDYPWGTVEIDGEKKVVCKCINRECSLFYECRKGISAFSEDELKEINVRLGQIDLSSDIIADCSSKGVEFKNSINQTDIINEKRQNRHLPLQCLDDESDSNDKKTSLENSKKIVSGLTASNGNEEKYDNSISLQSFLEWMTKNEYSIATSSGYISSIKSANRFARRKGIWEKDIFSLNTSVDVEKYIASLEESAYFKSSMENYIVALHCWLKYINECESERTSTNSSSLNADKFSNKINVSDSFENLLEKFKEVDQAEVIFATEESRLVINAGPGTGKTFSLIERLIYMVNDLNVNPEEILVLCFSRAAVEVIEERLKEANEEDRIGLNWNSIEIRTFDSFASSLLMYAMENCVEILPETFLIENLDYDGRIKAATNVVLKYPQIIEQCSHLIVDEVQDLVCSRAKFVISLIENLQENAGFTLFGDSCQAIYDYQVQNNEMDSSKFYSWLMAQNDGINYYSYRINYRQVSKLESMGNEYRSAILSGALEKSNEVLNKIYAEITELDGIDLRSAEYSELLRLMENDNIGILTRTNGQALKISTWFRNAGIPHKVQKRLTDNSLSSWIADIFYEYDSDTIDKDTFCNMMMCKGHSNLNIDDIWKTIEKSQYEAKDRYYVEDILLSITRNCKNSQFFALSDDEKITISNIHRSKGREFTNVILLDDMLINSEEINKDILEHKVSYVAITRAKKKIFRTNIGKQYIKTDKNGDRRAFATGRNFIKKKPYLSHIEVGRICDLNDSFFSMNENVQELFNDPLALVGERVILKKNKQSSYVCYDVYLEDEMSIGPIAQTSRKFFCDLKRILKEIHKLPPEADVYTNLYPSRFSDVYIDDVISLIGKFSENSTAAKRFGQQMIWKGITLIGFAQVERDSY